jgi:hypothetical protein
MLRFFGATWGCLPTNALHRATIRKLASALGVESSAHFFQAPICGNVHLPRLFVYLMQLFVYLLHLL